MGKQEPRPFLALHSYSKLATFIIIQHHIHRYEMFASITQRNIYQALGFGNKAMSSAYEEIALSVLVDPRQNESFVHVAPYEHIY